MTTITTVIVERKANVCGFKIIEVIIGYKKEWQKEVISGRIHLLRMIITIVKNLIFQIICIKKIE